MHFKMQAKIDKIKLIQCFNCQKWGNHISEMCKFEPVWGLFRFFHPPPPALLTKLLFSLLADKLSLAVWFKFLLNKVIANTCLFILTNFNKQSASWKVLEICELCALSTDSRKTYSVNNYM